MNTNLSNNAPTCCPGEYINEKAFSEEAKKQIKDYQESRRNYQIKIEISLAALKSFLTDRCYAYETLKRVLADATSGIEMEAYCTTKIQEIVKSEEERIKAESTTEDGGENGR